LRDRRGDVPILVRYFVRKYALRMARNTETIPSETMKALVNWQWPGNVRELENVVERSVILTEGKTLRVPLSELVGERQNADPANHTLERGGTRTHHSRVAGMHRLGLRTNRSGPSIGAEAEHFAVENAAAGNHSRRLQRSAARVGKLNPRLLGRPRCRLIGTTTAA
jgi:transcriptional regulator with GAF, ATPase, and Fis domain